MNRSWLALGLLFCACGEAPTDACTADGDCASGELCRDGVCEAAPDAGPPETDAGSPDVDSGPGADAGPCAACGPGEACEVDACVADCRRADAAPCEVDRVCSDASGACVEPGEECTPGGDFMACGGAEFPPVCGPGTMCEGTACVAVAPCASVTCDAVGVCRGVDCGATGGSVSGVTLDPVADAPRGAAGGLAVGATVAGEDLCGQTVTFEVRVETALYTSAGNDGAVFEVDLVTGARSAYIMGLPLVFGLVTDPVGALYVLRSDTCEVGRVVGPPGARTFDPLGPGPAGCSRLAVGSDGGLYVSGGLVVDRIDLFTGAVSRYGDIPDGVARWGSTFLTGLAFASDGSLIVGEHWDSLFSIAPGGGTGTLYATAPPLALTSGDNPWNEGMAFDRAGRLHVGVFPSNPAAGFVYRVNADLTTEVVEDLASIRADVPTTDHTGIHGVAFGLDGAMYFTNQNTRGNTREPFGQLLVRRTDGTVEVVADGFNFDWPRGYDGDLFVGTRVADSATAVVGLDGRATATLDVPDIAGAYEVRVFVTDPESGRVYSDADAARTL